MEMDSAAALECCSPWGRKEPDRTEQLNRTEKFIIQDRGCPGLLQGRGTSGHPLRDQKR